MPDPPVGSHVDTMTHPPVGSHVDTMTHPPVDSPGPCTRVFWDLMDFPLPDANPTVTVHLLQRTLGNIGFIGGVSIIAYVESFPDCLIDLYKLAGVTIIHHPQQGDMLLDIVLWALENPANYFEPLNLMVISKNIEKEIDFLSALEALEDRYYNVLLAMPQDHLLSSQLHTVSFDWLSSSLLDQSGTFIQCLNHKRKSRKKSLGFSDGLASLLPQYYIASKITVFWDVQDCLTRDAKIVPAILEKGYDCEVVIRPYVDEAYGDFQPRWLSGRCNCEWFNDCDCRFLMCVDPLTRVVTKEAKVTRMLLDLLFWAMNNDDTPQSFMLISNPDTNCDRVIKALEHRGFYNILETSVEGVSLPLLKSPSDEKMLINKSVKLQGRKLREGQRYGSIAKYATAVFWLLEGDCLSDPNLIERRIRSTLETKGYDTIESITVYVDKGKFPSELKAAYWESGTKLKFIHEDYGLAKIDIMSWDMIKSRYTNDYIQNFVVIAKPFRDTMFDCVLEDFEQRGLNVLLELPDYMVTFGSTVWSAKSILGNTSYPQEDSRFEIMSYPRDNSRVGTIFTSTGPGRSVNATFLAGPCKRVYWDVKDFPFPNCDDPCLIYESMKRIVEKEGFDGDFSIVAYVEESCPDELADAYEKAGFIIVYPPLGSDEHRCRLMFIDIAWCANEMQRGDSLVVISNLDGGKSRFLKFLNDWTYKNINVLLALPSFFSSKLPTVTFSSLYASLVDESITLQGRNLKRKQRDDSEQNESS